MRDEDDGEALALELGQRGEQLLDLLRHEHRGGLVEDDRARSAEQDLDDLDALAVADADVLDEGVRVDGEAVVAADLLDLLARLRELDDLLAVDRDGAGVGPVHPVQGLHERRLAGAVLAHDGVHRAAAHRDVDVVVGSDPGERLGDPRQLDDDVGDAPAGLGADGVLPAAWNVLRPGRYRVRAGAMVLIAWCQEVSSGPPRSPR